MRRYQSREDLKQQTVSLRADGLSIHAIARALGISRNTVRKILREHQKDRQEPHSALQPPPTRAPRAKKTDPYRDQVEKLVKKYDTITAQRVLEIIAESGYGGGYTAVKELVRKLRPTAKPKPSLETPNWGPGKMAESDWSEYLVPFTTGHKMKIQLFAYVLSQTQVSQL